jgi:hypothetical protein
MDMLLGILVGLGAGLAVAALTPEMHLHSPTDSAWRRIRAMAAGLVGAVAAEYGLVLLVPSLRTDGLTTALAALAGGLWLAGIVEVFSSRRRRGEHTMTVAPAPSDARNAIEMPAYDAARQALVAGLIEDARAHEAGRYAEIGRQLPSIRETVSRQDASWNSRLQLALRFWRGWTEARNELWQGTDSGKPITMAEWPRFARVIASDLALDRDTSDPIIVTRFAYTTPWPTAEAVPAARVPLAQRAD